MSAESAERVRAVVTAAVAEAQRTGFGTACRVLERVIETSVAGAPGVTPDYVRGWQDALTALRAAAVGLAAEDAGVTEEGT